MLNKVGGTRLGMKEIIELLIAIGAIIILALLLFNIFAPDFDKDQKTAESYLNRLEKELLQVDSGGEGEFYFFKLGEKDTDFYLVYFGKEVRVNNPNAQKKNEELEFYSIGNNENHMCICYRKYGEKDTFCSACSNLDHPVNLYGWDSWIRWPGSKLNISRVSDEYVFKQI